MKRIIGLMLLASWMPAQQGPPAKTIDNFFSEFTAEWVRRNPNQATSARYFTGDEQNVSNAS